MAIRNTKTFPPPSLPVHTNLGHVPSKKSCGRKPGFSYFPKSLLFHVVQGHQHRLETGGWLIKLIHNSETKKLICKSTAFILDRAFFAYFDVLESSCDNLISSSTIV